MNAKDIGLLERAFEAEIAAAMNGGPRVMQTKSKRASFLVESGMLAPLVEVWHGMAIEGYELTHAGRYAYCAQCDGEGLT